MRKLLVLFLGGLLLSQVSIAQTRTVGLMEIDQERVSDGFILWGPVFTTSKYLMDNCGNVVHSWDNGLVMGNSMYLQENGDLYTTFKFPSSNSVIQAGGSGDGFQVMDWESNISWDFTFSGDSFRAHHDIAVMPNGNVLVLTWEAISAGNCIKAGRNPALITEGFIASEAIYEIKKTGAKSGEIVWEWHLWDHLIQNFDPTKDNYGNPNAHPELLNLNFVNTKVANQGESDWIHSNAVDYNPDLDQVLFSSQRLGEFWVLDHSTTTAEAAGHTGGNHNKGGDFLYRWGNPMVYGKGDSSDQHLSGFHNPHWIEKGLPNEGKIMAFNNGTYTGTNSSSVVMVDPPVDANGDYALSPDSSYGPDQPFWEYIAPNPTDFYSWFISGANQLPNGNIFVCSGANGEFFEMTFNQEIVWAYTAPELLSGRMSQGDTIPINNGIKGNVVFRAVRYPFDYAPFAGRDLSPKYKVELNPLPDSCVGNRFFPPSALVYPNPANTSISVEIDNLYGTFSRLTIFNTLGKKVYDNDNPKPLNTIDISNWKEGVYILRVGDQQYTRFVKVR
ncbi:MAG: aryl-sulfate sulfotransferase [Bacteroidia bacterium]|nr:aryl-sulfate sulfotransferase [Bacteroidia bacterium]